MLDQALYERLNNYETVVAQMVSASGEKLHFTVYSREIESDGRSEKLKFISESLNLHVF